MAEGYLPEIVISITAEAARALTNIEEVRRALGDLPTDIEVVIALIAEDFGPGGQFSKINAELRDYESHVWITKLSTEKSQGFDLNLDRVAQDINERYSAVPFIATLDVEPGDFTEPLAQARRQAEPWTKEKFIAELHLSKDAVKDEATQARADVDPLWTDKPFITDLLLESKKSIDKVKSTEIEIREMWEKLQFIAQLQLSNTQVQPVLDTTVGNLTQNWTENKSFITKLGVDNTPARSGLISATEEIHAGWTSREFLTKLGAHHPNLPEHVGTATGYLHDNWEIKEFLTSLGAHIKNLPTGVGAGNAYLKENWEDQVHFTELDALATNLGKSLKSAAKTVKTDWVDQTFFTNLSATFEGLGPIIAEAITQIKTEYVSKTFYTNLDARLTKLVKSLKEADTRAEAWAQETYEKTFSVRTEQEVAPDTTEKGGVTWTGTLKDELAGLLTALNAIDEAQRLLTISHLGDEYLTLLETLGDVEAAQQSMSAFQWGNSSDLLKTLEVARDELISIAEVGAALDLHIDMPSFTTQLAAAKAYVESNPLTIDVVGELIPMMNSLHNIISEAQDLADAENFAARWTKDIRAAKNEVSSLIGRVNNIKFDDNLDEIVLQTQALVHMVNTADPTLNFKADFDQVAAGLAVAIADAEAQSRFISAGTALQERISPTAIDVDTTADSFQQVSALQQAAALMRQIVQGTQADPDPFHEWLSNLPRNIDLAKVKTVELAQQFDTEMEGALGMLGKGGAAPELGSSFGELHYKLILDDLPARAELDQMKIALAAVATEAANMKLDPEFATPVMAEIAKINAMISADKPALTIRADMAEAYANLEKFMAMAKADKASIAISAALNPASTPVTAVDAAGGGGNKEGMLASLGFGGGQLGGRFLGGLGIPALAAGGSIGSLAGFGTEHLLMTGVGLAGSLGGAAMGGGALATAGAATSAIGIGTDLAGMAQAARNAKGLSKDMEALDKAVAVYGANSRQAQTASATLAYDIGNITPVAQAATLALGTALHNLGDQFKTATGQAQATGAEILTQFVGVAHDYVPVIGKFAAENMGIIKSNIQPFISWLKDSGSAGGLGIFTQLEQTFQKNLPTAIHAGTQAFELFARTISHIIDTFGSGHLMKSIDGFVTRMNGADFSKWTSGIDSLINQFYVWKAFFKILAQDVFDIFKMTAGLAAGKPGDNTGIIPTLTGQLEHLHKALATTNRSTSSLGTIFSEHKTEILALLDSAIKIGTAFAQAYILVAPFLLSLTNVLLLLTKISSVKFMDIGGIVTGAAGITILLSKMGLLGPLLKGAGAEAGLLGKTVGALGFTGLMKGGEKRGLGAKLLGAREEGVANTGISGLMGGAADTVKLKGMYALDAIKKFGTDATTAIGAGLKDLWSGAGSIISSGFSSIGSFLGTSVVTFKNWGRDAASSVSQFATTGMSKMKNFASEAATTLSGWATKSASSVKKFALDSASSIVEFAGKGAGAFKKAGLAAASFAADFAKQLVSGAKKLVVFAVEHAVMAAAFIAENLAMAAAATVAFIAENAATFGIIAGIALLVGGIIYLATHWHQVWNGIKEIVLDGWNWIKKHFDLILIAMGPMGWAILLLKDNWQTVWGTIKTVVHDAWGVIQTVFGYVVDGAKLLWQGIQAYIGLVIDIFVKFPMTLLGYVADAGTWLFDTGKHIIEGLINGIKGMFGKIGSVVKDLAGNLLGGLGSLLGIASPSTITTTMGAQLSQGLANGITANAGAAATAAKTVSDQIKNAFGSLGGASDAAKATASLQQIFSNLGHVFDTLGTTANSAKNVNVSLGQITTGLQQLSKATQGGTGLAATINGLNSAFNGISNNKGLANIQTQMGNIGHIFDTVGKTAASAQQVTVGALQAILNATTLLSYAAKPMVDGIVGMTRAFGDFGNQTTLLSPSINKQLDNINTTVGKLSGVFTSFANLATDSAKVTASGMGDILTAIVNLNNALPWILVGLEVTKKEFDKFHDWKTLFGDLNNLMVLFGKISDAFQAVGKAAQDGQGVTVPAVSAITGALGTLASSLSGLPATIFAANAPITSMLKSLVDNMLSVLSGQLTLNSFNSVGMSMMNGLTAGIQAGSVGVIAAAVAVAQSTHDAVKTATQTKSPSKVYMKMGNDWMQGLVVGINSGKQGVQSALVGALPSTLGNQPHLAPTSIGGTNMTVHANITINAPGGNPQAIKNALTDSDLHRQFASSVLHSVRAGAGTQY